MVPRKLWPLVLPMIFASFVMASNARQSFHNPSYEPLASYERQLWHSPIHNSEFADVPHASARPRCERTHPPEALTTPNPLFHGNDPSVKIKVSFIVGADGRVHSPFILESAGTSEDQAILDAVRSWRYRPAMCNGVPTETEGRIEFSSR
jgi:TonB family protein